MIQEEELFSKITEQTPPTELQNIVSRILKETNEEQVEVVKKHYLSTGGKWSRETTIKQADEGLELLAETLERENTILVEVSLIEDSTANQITATVGNALSAGESIAAIQTAVLDAGIFGADRALRISRTITGSAASLGQLIAGEQAGATTKIWISSGFEVRPAHAERNGEKVGINERFSVKLGSSKGPRWPGDPEISAADRINCRCSLGFE